MIHVLILAVAIPPVLFFASHFKRRDWSFLDPINSFWIVYLLFGVVQPLSQAEPCASEYGNGAVETTLLVTALVGPLVWFGYGLGEGRALAHTLPVLRGTEVPSRFFWVGIGCLCIGLLAQAYVIWVSGGVETYLSTARTFIDFSNVSSLVLTIVHLRTVGLMIVLCVATTSRHHRYLRAPAYSLALAELVWSIYSGTRSGVITVAAITLGATYGPKRRNPGILIGSLSAVAIVVLLGFVWAYRGEMYEARLHTEDRPNQALDRSLRFYTTQDRGGVIVGSEFHMSVAAVYHVPRDIPYDFGRLLLELVTRPIPRAVWPGKVYPEGEAWDRFHSVAGTAYWRNAAGLLSGPAPGFVGKWWYMFGAPGVLLGAIWTGIFLQAVGAYGRRYEGITGVLIAVSCVLLGFSEMNNPLLWPIVFIPNTAFALFIVLLIARKGGCRLLPPGWFASRRIIQDRARFHAPQSDIELGRTVGGSCGSR